MQDLAIFAIAHQRTRWLEARTAVLAHNIANADTPGFQARDIAPFESTMNKVRVGIGRTQATHIVPEGLAGGEFELRPRDGSEGKISGNSVSLELEMASLGEARSQHSVVTGVLGAFHRMLMSSVRG